MSTSVGFFAILLLLMVLGARSFLCRKRNGLTLLPETYRLSTCAECYGYLYHDKPLRPVMPKYLIVNNNRSVIIDNNTLIADVTNPVYKKGICATLNYDQCDRWISCCSAANDCCERQLADAQRDNQSYCPRTWDGWGCWKDTSVGTKGYISCPAYIQYSIPSRFAVKTCNKNSTWLKNRNQEWTDYTPCLDKEGLIITVYVSLCCNLASILVLGPAIAIFVYFRGLRHQHRIRVHLNLFTSLILGGVSSILWDVLVTYDKLTNKNTVDTRMYLNTTGCRILSVLKIYFKSTNYMWMFCEGYYLHRLIYSAFKPPKSLLRLYLVGWGIPVISSAIYSALRVIYANESCWAISFGGYEWIIYAPNLICLVANVVFLCHILKILTTQLHVHPNEPSSFRRALKATFVLLPLFGLHLFVTIYRMPPGTPGESTYEQFTIFIMKSQGLFVALLFCFLNGEVLGLLCRRCSRPEDHRYKSCQNSQTQLRIVPPTLSNGCQIHQV